MNLKLERLPLSVSAAPKLSDSPSAMIRRYATNEKTILLLFVTIVEFTNKFKVKKLQNQ